MDKWMGSKSFVQMVALMLGILLWAVVHLDQPSDPPVQTDTGNARQSMIFSDVQISVVGLDEELYHLSSLNPAFVKVTVSGKNEDIANINKGMFDNEIVLDLSKLGEGTHLIPLLSRGYPENVGIEIEPSAVTVKLEKYQQKEVPVEVVITGEPDEGFRQSAAVVQPSRVNVEVPASRLNDIIKAQVTIDITGARRTVTVERTLAAINAAGETVDALIQPSVAFVIVPITSPFKMIPLQVKLNGEVPPGYAIASFEQSADRVTIYGSETDIEKYDFYGGITLNVADLNRAQTYNYTYNIPLQEGLHQVLPETVELELRVVASAKKRLDNVPVILLGRNEDVITEVTVPDINQFSLEIEGAPELLDDIRPVDVQAIIDVSNLPPGEYTRQIQLNLPRFIKFAGDPQQLEATVRISTIPEPEPEEEDEPVTGEGEQGDTSDPGDAGDSGNGETDNGDEAEDGIDGDGGETSGEDAEGSE